MDSYLNTWHILEFMNITTGFLIINHYPCNRSSEGMLLRTVLTNLYSDLHLLRNLIIHITPYYRRAMIILDQRRRQRNQSPKLIQALTPPDNILRDTPATLSRAGPADELLCRKLVRQLVVCQGEDLVDGPAAEKRAVPLAPFVGGGDFPELAGAGEGRVGEALAAAGFALAEGDFEEHFDDVEEA